MGGHRAGEIASSMVVIHMGSRFSELSTIGSKLDAASWLNENIGEINLNIIKYAEENPEATGFRHYSSNGLTYKRFDICYHW